MARTVASFYLEESVAKSFREYAKRVPGKTVGEVLEEALVEYMGNHPVELFVSPIQLTIGDTLGDKKEEIRVRLLTKQIQRVSKILANIDENGVGEREKWEAKLVELLLRGTEVKNGGEEFLAVLEEAYELVR